MTYEKYIAHLKVKKNCIVPLFSIIVLTEDSELRKSKSWKETETKDKLLNGLQNRGGFCRAY